MYLDVCTALLFIINYLTFFGYFIMRFTFCFSISINTQSINQSTNQPTNQPTPPRPKINKPKNQTAHNTYTHQKHHPMTQVGAHGVQVEWRILIQQISALSADGRQPKRGRAGAAAGRGGCPGQPTGPEFEAWVNIDVDLGAGSTDDGPRREQGKTKLRPRPTRLRSPAPLTSCCLCSTRSCPIHVPLMSVPCFPRARLSN